MGRRRLIDIDEDLLDADQAAAYIGLTSGGSSFHVYAQRFGEELEPAIKRGRYIRLWLRQDLDRFLQRHPGIGKRTDPSPDVTPPA